MDRRKKKKTAEAIKRWKPWEKSTGPKTDEGKAKACRNAFKGGGYTLFRKETLELLRINRSFVKQCKKLVARQVLLCETNELLKSKLNQRGHQCPSPKKVINELIENEPQLRH